MCLLDFLPFYLPLSAHGGEVSRRHDTGTFSHGSRPREVQEGDVERMAELFASDLAMAGLHIPTATHEYHGGGRPQESAYLVQARGIVLERDRAAVIIDVAQGWAMHIACAKVRVEVTRRKGRRA